MDLLDRLLDHDDWASTTLLDLCRPLTDAQLDQELDIGHRTLRETWVHMIFNIDVWTAAMTSRPPEGIEDDRSIPALIDRYQRMYATFAAFARLIRDEQRLDDTYVDHYGGEMTYGGAILHVVLHNEGHRTEVLHFLQRLGLAEDPEVDHGLWDFHRRGLT